MTQKHNWSKKRGDAWCTRRGCSRERHEGNGFIEYKGGITARSDKPGSCGGDVPKEERSASSDRTRACCGGTDVNPDECTQDCDTRGAEQCLCSVSGLKTCPRHNKKEKNPKTGKHDWSPRDPADPGQWRFCMREGCRWEFNARKERYRVRGASVLGEKRKPDPCKGAP